MGSEDIKHFLVTHDTSTGEISVKGFGTDYEAAQDAYENVERVGANRPELDVVLLGADSLATIEQTHPSYSPGRVSNICSLVTNDTGRYPRG